jgi:hypothetical protein
MDTASVWVAPEARVGSWFGWSDFEPTDHGQLGVRGGLNWRLMGAVGLAVSGYLGGTSFRFTGPGAAGKVETVRWDTRAGLDFSTQVGPKSSVWAGVAYEYGEARSWLDSAQLSEGGPHNYLVGVSFSAGEAVRVARRMDVRCYLGLSELWGRASGVATTNDYRWVGSDLTLGLGLAYRFR